MKKRISLFVVILMLIAASFSVAACTQPIAGKSAYEIACDNGFVGSEREWLESLKGTDGQDAPALDIYDLFDVYLENNPGNTFADFLAALSIADYQDAEFATAKGIQSAVSIYSTFVQNNQGQDAEYMGAGAGVVYRIDDEDVYILTNYHVVYDRDCTEEHGIARKVEVYSYGFETLGKGVLAQFMGGSISKDIAVLKTDLRDFSSDIKAVVLADSGDILLGETTIAIGNPSAEGISVSVGAVSVDSEQIEMESLESPYSRISMRVIRTDTAINKGNSGGGLFNRRGQLIGIVNAKTIQSGVENIGYAIPINVAAGIADCVIENEGKKVILGIMATTLSTRTQFNTERNRVEIIEIVTVDSVSEGVLAEGKIEAEDNLLAVRINEGETVALTRLFHLSDYLYKVRLGDTIYLTIERDGEQLEVELTPAAADFPAV